MKTYKHLFEQVCHFDNLWLAFQRARPSKRSKAAVAAFEYQLERNLFTLDHELREGSYAPGRYRNFYIHEPKRRKISAAPFRDRVVHHALCNVIEPIFERRFIDNSCACRIGKGTHRALDRAQDYARRYRYVLQGDVVQFFPSIDHQILRGLLARRIGVACPPTGSRIPPTGSRVPPPVVCPPTGSWARPRNRVAHRAKG